MKDSENSKSIDPYSKVFLDLAENLLAQDQEPDSVLVCPICNGRLYISSDVRLKHGKPFASMSFECQDCDATVHLDGITLMPSWLKSENDFASCNG